MCVRVASFRIRHPPSICLPSQRILLLSHFRRKAAPQSLPTCHARAVNHGADQFEQVLAAAKLGEEWALSRLFRDLHPAVVRYFHGTSSADAEDLAVDVWLEVARIIPNFEGTADGFRSLVFTVARRRSIDYGRKRARRRTDLTDDVPLHAIASRSDTESDALERADGEEAVQRIVSMLTPEQAEVIVLRVVAGLSVAEVAEITGRSTGAVSVIQHRALRRLARRMGDTRPRTSS